MAKFTKETAAQFGSKGGRRTVERHGSKHMAKIGVRGFWRTVERHWRGDARAYVNYLLMMGWAATDPMPYNGAFVHDREVMRRRALAGYNHLRGRWLPPSIPADMDITPLY